MTSPAVRDNQSPLEAALVDVHTTLADLLVAADEQYTAVIAHDHERLESVTRQQERLSARLARAEANRLEVLGGASLSAVITELGSADAHRIEALRNAIATSVRDLKTGQSRTAQLLELSLELGKHTLEFLHDLVTIPGLAYNDRGLRTPRHSVLVDGRA
jgi:hypothetical protein